MTIHAAATAINLRFFQQGSDVDVDKPIHEMKEPYERFCTATINDAGVARIEGLTFTVSISEHREILRILHRFGAKTVTWRHNGKPSEYYVLTGRRVKKEE